VAQALAQQPIPRLQRPGSWTAATTYEPFLYDDSGFDEHISARRAVAMEVVLRPGVGAALVRAAPVLRPMVEHEWTRMVADLNGVARSEERLRAFLFGAERVSLGPVGRALRDQGTDDCFWCGARLPASAVQVDHVVPWSSFPNDSLFNLVLADATCNLDKRDTLVAAEAITRWVGRQEAPLLDIGRELDWPVDRAGSLATAVAAYTWLPEGLPLWRRRGVVAPATVSDRLTILAALRRAA
jgi:hypothetical protein